MTTHDRPGILICGAGPTGLMLALRLARSNVKVRIIDSAAEPGTTSRALVVHARTLEFYRQMGLDGPFLKIALPFDAVNLWVRGRPVARVAFREPGKGLSRYPFMTVCTQDRHERFLVEHLSRAGVEVERRTELLDFTQSPDGVRARLKRADGGEETCEAAYLAGCDGARSRTREVLGAGFPGGTYASFFYVADVDAGGPVMNDELHVGLDEADFVAIFPLRGRRTGRLIGILRAEQESVRESLTWEDVYHAAAERLRVRVDRVNWFSTYRVHHRVASRFRDGRVFLLGDAAHVHSPVGAQGMNTGLGDAVNLAWKLADVLHGRARERILDTYEPERMSFARGLVSTTDRVFVLATSFGRVARFVRTRLVPVIVPLAFRSQAMRRFLFRTVSQIKIRYRDSALSAGSAGSVHGGDRLPWVEPGDGDSGSDNFEGIDGLRWQAHVYGAAPRDLADECRRLGLPLRVFAWRPAMGAAGLARDALYLIRPDGHVALAASREARDTLARYWSTVAGSDLA